ncbi:MAG: hypothetical protein CM1200mP9_05770 [Gammaproteobacteria bacterium]|nr:MAG: hypothetical protein CM1200mP9_05770 [Gammaproteobacteria bacterium]
MGLPFAFVQYPGSVDHPYKTNSLALGWRVDKVLTVQQDCDFSRTKGPPLLDGISEPLNFLRNQIWTLHRDEVREIGQVNVKAMFKRPASSGHVGDREKSISYGHFHRGKHA